MAPVTYDPTMVRDALARHYVAHGLPSDGGEGERWFHVHIGSVTVHLPNPPARRRALFFHDVNHVLTGYNTAFSDGEMAIAGFEVGSGCGPFWVAWYLNLSMVALGLVVCPRAVFRAFVRGRRASSLYHRREDRATLSAMSVGELRALLGLDRAPAAAGVGDRVRFVAWSIAAGVMILAPVVAALMALRGVWQTPGQVGPSS